MNTKLTISKSMYIKLLDDKELFKFKSENDFYTTIILNTYKYEDQTKRINLIKNKLITAINTFQYNSIAESIQSHKNDKQFNKELTEIAILLSSSLNNDDNELQYEKKYIYVRDTAKTKQELETIYNETIYINAATLFKHIISNYLSYPLYIREKIIFLQTYNKLIELKKSGLSCKLKTKNAEFNYDLYDVIPNKDGYHYYLIGYGSTNKLKRQIICFKLSTITNVMRTTSAIDISNEEENEMKDKIEKGVEWIGDTFLNDCQVLFDEKGLERYEDLYKDRPRGKLITNNIMSFSCSKTQLFNYLRQFGSHAIVLNNSSLKKSLITHYKNALEKYNE